MNEALIEIGKGLLIILGVAVASSLILCTIVIWEYIVYVTKEM